MARLRRIVAELQDRGIEQVAISGFTEPSYDKGLTEKVAALRAAGLSVAIYSNASNLRPALVDELLALGVEGFVINLSTLDEAEYLAMRGTKDLKRVRPNLDYLVSRSAAAAQVSIVVIGALDERHARNLRAIDAAYGARAKVTIMPMLEFAAEGYQIYADKPRLERLQGCLWQRHTDWLHVNADGNAILCCRDYDARYVIGNTDAQDLDALLGSERLREWQRWVDGVEEAPADFICRTCFAALRPDYLAFLESFYCSRCVLPRELGQALACPRCNDVGDAIAYLRARDEEV